VIREFRGGENDGVQLHQVPRDLPFGLILLGEGIRAENEIGIKKCRLKHDDRKGIPVRRQRRIREGDYVFMLFYQEDVMTPDSSAKASATAELFFCGNEH
jgi:hypothetical protein